MALIVHLALAVLLARRAPGWLEASAEPSPPTLPVVLVRPLPVPPPIPPPPPEEEPAVEVPAAPVGEVTVEPQGEYRPRRPDLVFVIDEPEYAETGTPRVAGTAGVTVPEVAPESMEEALRIGRMERRGWVVLRVLVLRDGSAGEVTVEQAGDTEAAAGMARAVRALRFRPALERGRPVDAWYTLVWPPQ